MKSIRSSNNCYVLDTKIIDKIKFSQAQSRLYVYCNKAYIRVVMHDKLENRYALMLTIINILFTYHELIHS